MNRIIKLTLFLFVAFLLIAAPTSTLADKGEDERAMLAVYLQPAPLADKGKEEQKDLSGSIWLIPSGFDILTVFEVKPDGAVEAGYGGYLGLTKEVKWIGTYRNGQLELRNKGYEETRAAGKPAPNETITARIDGSKMTGHYSLVYRVLGTNDQDDFSGYCVNCFGYGPVIVIVTIGGIAIVLTGGGIALLRRNRRKSGQGVTDPSPADGTGPDNTDAESDNREESDTDEEDKSCGGRFQRVVAAIDDYKRHARIIQDVIEERRSIATGWKTIEALEPEIEAAEKDYHSHLKYLWALETFEQVNDWGGDALVWGGGLVSGGVSRLASVRAGRILKLVEWAERIGVPATAFNATAMKSQAALLGKVSDLATLLGFFAATAATGAHFAPKSRKSLGNMYQGILQVRMELEKAKMELRIRRQKLNGRKGLTLDDQIKRFNRVDALRQRLNQGCPDEHAEIKRLIGPNMEELQDRLHGLKRGWENVEDPTKLEDTSGVDEWRYN